MKKRILLFLILVYFIFSNDILAFSSEIPSVESEDTIDETDYSMHAFGERTSDEMSVYASVEELLPEKAQMKVSIVTQDSNKVDDVMYLYNEHDKIINITSINIGFFNNEEVIRLKDGTVVHFEILMNIEGQETTGDYKIFRLTDKGKYEEIPANETSVKGSFTDLEDNSVKKQFSFDIVSEPAISDSFKFFIIEYEAFTEQNQGETIPEQIVDEPTTEQVEVEPSNEETETEVMPKQEEIEITPEQEGTETVSEQNDVESEAGQEVVETIPEQNKTETKPENKDVEENTAKPDKAEKKPEKSSESQTIKQDKTEKEHKRSETINIDGKVIFDDSNNQDGIRPSSVKFSLRDSNGKTYPITVEKNEKYENIWEYSVKNLPKYSSEKELKYSIVNKEKVKGYDKPEIDGYDIKYFHDPEKVLIEGQIMWDDSINKDKIRPKEVTVELYGDGDYKASNLVSKETKWKYSFGEFPKYDAGREIEYSIKEETIDGYESKPYGFNITNIHEAGNEDASIETTKSEVSNETSKTWKKSNVVCFIVIMILFIAIMIFIIIKSEFFK